jgi:hypothetical protein
VSPGRYHGGMPRGRARVLVACLALAACKGNAPPAPVKVAEPIPAAPRPIAVCDEYVAALGQGADLDLDADVRALLRDEAALLRAAIRDPRPAERDELTVRCARGLVDLSRLAASVGGSLVPRRYRQNVPVPAAPAPARRSPDLTLSCRRLFDLLDRMARCPNLPDALKDSLRQSRSIMIDTYSQVPQDPDMRDAMEEGCRVAVDGYDQVLSYYHCP